MTTSSSNSILDNRQWAHNSQPSARPQAVSEPPVLSVSGRPTGSSSQSNADQTVRGSERAEAGEPRQPVTGD
jgi:hypothetical protein